MYLNVVKRPLRLLAVFLVLTVLAGCGQGDGPQPIAGTAQPTQKGVLVDAPVSGVTWESTDGTSGVTNELGEFSFVPFEMITFSIGGIVLGVAEGASFITVVELTKSPDPTATAATNQLIFLQSIDEDADLSNGIRVSASAVAAAAGLTLDFSSASFDTDVAAVVNTLAPGNAVVSAGDALNHFYTTYSDLKGTDTFGFPFPGYPAVGGGSDTFALVFADEFNTGDAPDSAVWNLETGYGPNNFGWGNNEWQLYTTDPQNVRVEDGNLVIQARCDAPPCGSRDGTVTSARLTTQNKFSFQYGKVVARIKPPVGTASWPAFWALGSRFPGTSWPSAGEIDFMEMFQGRSNERTTHSTMHWCDENIQAPAACSFPQGWRFETQSRTFGTSLGDDFHIWEADWNSDRINMSIDGIQYFSFPIEAATMEEFLEEFFLILNVAMGGTLGSNEDPPSGTETWPQTMLVDYVRVFQRTGSGSGGTPGGFAGDFEEDPSTYDFGEGGGFEGGFADVVANPVPGGINTSAQVARFLKGAGAVFAGSRLALPTPIQVESGTSYSVKVWSPRPVMLTFKLEGATQDQSIEREAMHPGGSEWVELTFEYGTYSETVEGYTFIFDNGTTGNATDDPANWTFYADDITLIPGDNTAPMLSSVSIASSNTTTGLAAAGDVITVSFTANEAIMTPEVTIAGSAATVTGADATWQATRTLTATDTEGAIEFSIGYSDLAGNAGVAVTRPSDTTAVTFDSTVPSVTISGVGATLTTLAPFTVTFGFDEAVSGFDISDIVVTNGAASDFVSDSTTTYTATITPAGDGVLTVNTASGAAADLAGNASAAATEATALIDSTGPMIAITGVPANFDTLSVISVMFQFSEPVSGFNRSDIQVTNGVATGFVAVDGTNFMANVNPTGAGNLTVGVAAGAAQDAAGNPSVAAADVTALIDAVAPTVAIAGVPATFDNLDSFTVTFQFAELVTGFALSDIQVTNGTASTFVTVTDGTVYTAVVRPNGAGDLTVDVPAGAAQDRVRNPSVAAMSATALIDAVAPTLAIEGVPTAFDTLAPINVTFRFLEPVTGFELSDIQVTNGAATAFTAVSGGVVYTAVVTPDGAGDLTVGVAAGAAQDLVGNPSVVAASVTALIDAVPPTLVITGAPPSFDNTVSIPLTFQFTENVTGFVATDIQVTNGQVSANSFNQVDGDTYTASVTPTGFGNLTIGAAAGAAQDAVGNQSLMATNVVVVNMIATDIARLNPVSIASNNSTNSAFATTGDLVTITMTASEAIMTPTVMIANRPADSVTGSGTGWVASSTMLATDNEGAIPFIVTFTDLDGDAGLQSSITTDQTMVTFDITAPTLMISAASPTFDSLVPIAVTFQFLEGVTGFGAEDIMVTNGSASAPVAVNGSTSTYMANVTPDGGMGDLTISVAANTVLDFAGLPNAVAANLVLTNATDEQPPELVNVSITSSNANSLFATNGDVVTIDLVANEDIVAPTVVISGQAAAVSNVSGGTAWQATLTLPGSDGEGLVVFTINYADIAGNAGDQVTATNNGSSVTYDPTAPTLSSVSISSSNTNSLFATNGDVVTIDMIASEAINTPEVVIGGQAAVVTNVSGATVWRATLTLPGTDGEGPVAFTIDFADLAGNAGTQTSATNDGSSVAYDPAAPTLDIIGLSTEFTTVDPITVTFEFSEAVNGFDVTDIEVTNGVADAGTFMAAPGMDEYSVVITPDSMGDLTVAVAEGQATDNAGNPNSAASVSSTQNLTPFWSLVWSDGFDGGALDTMNWTARTDVDCRPQPCVGEQGYNVGNVTVAGGQLVITAQENSSPPYLSGFVDTRGKREFKYGRVEVDATMPGTLGARPSLRLLPVADVYGPWPQSGEVDIANGPDLGGGNVQLEHNLQYGLPVPENTVTSGIYDATAAPDATSITYALEWEAGEIRWFVDNDGKAGPMAEVNVLTQSDENWYAYGEDDDGVYALGTDDAPFNEQFYLALNLAVDSSANMSSTFPQTLQVDEVRVYECAFTSDPVGGTGCGTGTMLPVDAPDAPYTESIAVYTNGLATMLDFVDESMMVTSGSLVTDIVTSDASMVSVTSTLEDTDGTDTFWSLDVGAATGNADIRVKPADTFPDPGGAVSETVAFFDLSNGGTAGEILFRLRVNTETGSPAVTVGLEGSDGGSGAVALPYSADGEWHNVSVKLSDIVTNSVTNSTPLDLKNIASIFKLSVSTGSIDLDIDDIEVKVACRDDAGCEATPSVKQAPEVQEYSQDFEGMGALTILFDTASGDIWRMFNAVYEDGVLLFTFNAGDAAPNGDAISTIVQNEGGVPQGTNVLSVFSTYECCAGNDGEYNTPDDQGHFSPTGLGTVEVNVFKEFINADSLLTADDAGKILKFQFDAKRGNIAGATEATAFIKVLDSTDNLFTLTAIATLETTAISTDWMTYSIKMTVGDWENWDAQVVQIGFATLSGNFDPAGIFYDNVKLSRISP